MRETISPKLLIFGFLIASALSVGALAAAGLPYSPLANFGDTDDPYGPYGRPAVWIEPHAPDDALPGEHVYIDVWSIAMDGAQPAGWQYDLDYDPNLLTFLGAEPLLPSIVAQDPPVEPCISAYHDHGDFISTAIVCQLPAPGSEVPLARYWFEVETNLPVGTFVPVNVGNTFVGSYGHPPQEIESQGHSDAIAIAGGICGDQNDDGRVTILDAIIDMQIIVGVTEPTGRQIVLSDLDDDDRITVVDVITLLQYIVGRIDHLDCGVPPFATQCPSPAVIDGPGPHVTGLDWTMHPNNSLIFNFAVDLNEPGMVWTEYWPMDGSGGALRSAPSGPGTVHDFQVMRLRSDTTYCFWVYAADDSANNVGPLDHDAPPVTGIVAGSLFTGSLPAGLAGASFTQILGRSTYDLTLMDMNDDDYSGFVAIDQDTDIVWYYEHPAFPQAIAQKDDLNLVFVQQNGVEMYEIEPDGTVVEQISDTLNGQVCEPGGRWHHEVVVLSDGTVLTLGSEIRPIEFPGTNTQSNQMISTVDELLGEEILLLSGVSDGVIRNQTGDTIEQWDMQAGTVTRLLSLFDVLDPTVGRTPDSNIVGGFLWQGCNRDQPAEDWTHSNSLWPTQDGNVLVSSRHLDAITKVDPVTDTLIWKLGGSDSDFAFPDPSDRFYHQHSAVELPNGNILLFDNGNFRPVAEGGEYSRALELHLDMTTMTATKVWEYRHPQNLYAKCCSIVRPLANGNVVVVFGANTQNDACCRTYALVEADPSGNAVSEIAIRKTDKVVQYRVYPLDTINGESKR